MFYFGYTFLLCALAAFCGFGAAALTLPGGLRRYTLLFAPWYGLAYLGLAVYLCYRANLPGTDHYAGWLLLPPLALAAWALLRRGSLSRKRELWLNSEVALAAIPIATAVLIFAALYLHAADFLTSLTIGNNDLGSYSYTALLVKEYPRSAAAPLWGPISQVPLDLADLNWSLPAYFIAVAASLFRLHPYELDTLAVAALFALTVAMFYPLSRRCGLNRRNAVLLGLVYAASPLMGNLVLNGLAGEVAGIGFVLMALALARSADGPRWRGGPALIAAFAGLLIAYAISLPIVALLAVVMAAFDFSRDEIGAALPRLRRIAWRIGLALIAVLAFCEPRLVAEAHSLFFLGNQSTGWFVPWLSPAVLWGYFMPLPLRVCGIPFTVLFLGLLLGVVLLPKARARPVPFLLAFGYLGLYLLLCWLGRGEGEGIWGGYKAYKFATLLLPVFLVISGKLLQGGAERPPLFRVAFPLVCGLALLGAAISDICAWRAIPGKEILTRSLIDLRAVNARADVVSVTAPRWSLWEGGWLNELLASKRLYVVPEIVPDAEVAGNWDLLRLNDGLLREDGQLFTIWTGVPRPGDLLRINPDFGLRRHFSRPIEAVVPGPGWWPDEKDHRWTGSAGREAAVEILCSRDKVAAALAFTLELSPGETVAVLIDGNEVARIAASGPRRLPLILHLGSNEIVFRSSLDPVRHFPKDRRLLGIRFTQWTVEELQ